MSGAGVGRKAVPLHRHTAQKVRDLPVVLAVLGEHQEVFLFEIKDSFQLQHCIGA